MLKMDGLDLVRNNCWTKARKNGSRDVDVDKKELVPGLYWSETKCGADANQL